MSISRNSQLKKFYFDFSLILLILIFLVKQLFYRLKNDYNRLQTKDIRQ